MNKYTIYYIILDQKSGKHLPWNKRGYSQTRVELTDSEPPRLFKKRSDAKIALDWWVLGITTNRFTEYGDYELHTVAKPERKELDLVICPIYLEKNLSLAVKR